MYSVADTRSTASVKPLISVVLPVYNGGAYLHQSIQSVLNQSLNEFEFLILDDCSTDDSWDYVCSITDCRVKIFRNASNKGLFYNLNYLIRQANAPLIKLWSQDDIMYPHCLQAFADFHHRNPFVGFSYSGRDKIDENGKLKKPYPTDHTPQLISSELHARIAFFTGSIAGNIANVCIRKKALDEVGLFKEHMSISADFDMWVRLAKDHETGFIQDKLIQLRDHNGQLSRNESLYVIHVKEDLEVYRYLQGCVSTGLQREGKQVLRNHKLVFYYTLMVKALLKGRLRTCYRFYRELSHFDNFFMLSLCFLRAKLYKAPQPAFVKRQTETIKQNEKA